MGELDHFQEFRGEVVVFPVPNDADQYDRSADAEPCDETKDKLLMFEDCSIHRQE